MIYARILLKKGQTQLKYLVKFNQVGLTSERIFIFSSNCTISY